MLGTGRSLLWPGSSVGTSVRLKSGRSAVRPRPWPPPLTCENTCARPIGRALWSQFWSHLAPLISIARRPRTPSRWRPRRSVRSSAGRYCVRGHSDARSVCCQVCRPWRDHGCRHRLPQGYSSPSGAPSQRPAPCSEAGRRALRKHDGTQGQPVLTTTQGHERLGTVRPRLPDHGLRRTSSPPNSQAPGTTNRLLGGIGVPASEYHAPAHNQAGGYSPGAYRRRTVVFLTR